MTQNQLRLANSSTVFKDLQRDSVKLGEWKRQQQMTFYIDTCKLMGTGWIKLSYAYTLEDFKLILSSKKGSWNHCDHSMRPLHCVQLWSKTARGVRMQRHKMMNNKNSITMLSYKSMV